MEEPHIAPSPSPEPTIPEPSLARAKHLKYWLRNLQSSLPDAYTPTDLSRLSLAFFSLSALDLLGELHTSTTTQQRRDWADWFYLCQLPGGGFRGGPATIGAGDVWDVANLPACYFALAGLAILGDDFKRVNWVGLGEFLAKVQRQDGGFGEWIMKDGLLGGERGGEDFVMGGEDMRFMYCAMAVRWIMRRGGVDGSSISGELEKRQKMGIEGVKDVDVEGCVRFIKSSMTYDSGFAAFPFIEAHAGHAYCAISALSLLDRLHEGIPPSALPSILRWLVSMQVPYVPELEPDQDDNAEINQSINPGSTTNTTTLTSSNASLQLPPEKAFSPPTDDLPGLTSPLRNVLGKEGYIHGKLTGGFCGRLNKRGDTCYSFWVGGALDVLGHAELMDRQANRRFLLGHTQHIFGGFGKLPGIEYRPDILHSYLGLAALSICGEPGLKKIDSALCISVDVKERIMRMP